MTATAQLVLLLTSTGESSWGTTGASTIKLHGVENADLTIVSKNEVVPSVGWFGPSPTAEQMARSASFHIDGTLSYEEGPKIANNFFAAIGASTSTSGAAPYAYPYTAPVASTQASYTWNLEYGSTGKAYRETGAFGTKLGIKGEAGGFWKFNIDGLGKDVRPASTGGGYTTAANVDRTVNPVKMSDTTLSIDVSTGTIGTSAVSNTLISFELDYNNNRHLKQFAGSIQPASWGDGKNSGTLKLRAEFNASAQALVDELLDGATGGSTGAAVKKLIRIAATAGSSASAKVARIDFAGIKQSGEKLFEDRDGNVVVDFTFDGWYSTSLGNWLAMHFENGSSSTT